MAALKIQVDVYKVAFMLYLPLYLCALSLISVEKCKRISSMFADDISSGMEIDLGKYKMQYEK